MIGKHFFDTIHTYKKKIVLRKRKSNRVSSACVDIFAVFLFAIIFFTHLFNSSTSLKFLRHIKIMIFIRNLCSTFSIHGKIMHSLKHFNNYYTKITAIVNFRRSASTKIFSYWRKNFHYIETPVNLRRTLYSTTKNRQPRSFHIFSADCPKESRIR